MRLTTAPFPLEMVTLTRFGVETQQDVLFFRIISGVGRQEFLDTVILSGLCIYYGSQLAAAKADFWQSAIVCYIQYNISSC